MASDGSSWWPDKIKWLWGVQDLQKLASMSSKDRVRLFPISSLARYRRLLVQTRKKRDITVMGVTAPCKKYWPLIKDSNKDPASCIQAAVTEKISLPVKQHLDQNSSPHCTWLSNLSLIMWLQSRCYFFYLL